jgi:hypothetical protein
MRSREFILDHRLVWKRSSDGRVTMKWRCDSGPRKNRTVSRAMDCSAAPDVAQSQRMKKTRAKTKIRQARKTKRTKKINPSSKLASRLNVYGRKKKGRVNEAVGGNVQELYDAMVHFLPLAMEVLGINKLPKIEIRNKIHSDGITSFGTFSPVQNYVRLAIVNRHIVDVLRTLAHELVHFKQRMSNQLNQDSGETGSDIENEANATAAIIIRQFNEKYPHYLDYGVPVLERSTSGPKKVKEAGLMYRGYPCTKDCSGHMAGYDWAERNAVDSEDDCAYGNNDSFWQGCLSKAQGK